MLTTPKTQLQLDRDANDARVKRIATALHYVAGVMTHEHREYWSLSDDRLLAVLNDDVAVTFARNEANDKIANAINDALGALNDPELTHRAPTAPGRSDIGFADGAFFIIPPPPPPEPEPDPKSEEQPVEELQP